ncbi:DEAD/DEAH box helicase [Psittacicella gerlachiana]|nr:DEAD/DEAH box helicase [Psittacicella gerlachiana]
MGQNNVIPSEDETKLYVWTRLAKEICDIIPDAIVHHNPDASTSNSQNSIVEVDWTFDNAQKLASINATTLSPIVRKSDYDWPGELTPFEHQYKISAFLSVHKSCFCLADMGTGKTLATLHAINYLYKIKQIKKVLIVCPLSVMRDAWQSTLQSMDCGLTSQILYANTKKKRIELVTETDAQIHIINPDGVEVIQSQLLEQNYDLIVIDELTTYKTHTTARWKNLQKITKKASFVWGITGTPVPNSPLEAYGQILMVAPQNLTGITYSHFKGIMNLNLNLRFLNSASDNIEDFKSVEMSLDLVYSYFNPAIRIKKEDCLDLPDLVTTYSKCELSNEQKHMIKQLREYEFVRLKNGANIAPANGAAIVGKIIQACCGAVYDNSKEIITLDNKSRVQEAIRLIEIARSERTEFNKGKTLVFVPYKSTLDLLYDELATKFKVAKINSDVREKERAEIFHKLQNTDDLDVLLAIPTTMSHGITATSASLIIWFAPIHSCETYIQACNRINRAGQTQKMTIAHLYGHDIEYKIYKSLEAKQFNLKELLNLYNEFLKGE